MPGVADGAWWELARALSPRPRLRVDSRGPDGWRHAYDRTRALSSSEPTGPYALHLAGADRRYRLLLFDLDASRGPAADDFRTLLDWCADAGLRPIAAESGPGGGRHVWLVLADPISANYVRQLAYAAARRLPSLDPSPLLNPITGCGRPPGAWHRDGGRSQPLTALRTARRVVDSGGDPHAAVARLLGFLLQSGGEPVPAEPAGEPRSTPVDAHGHPYLLGARRRLPPSAATALAAGPGPGDDASAVLWTVLTGAALARWRHADVEAQMDAPGLEYVRTKRARGHLRVPRSPGEPRGQLARQWHRAVGYAATLPPPDAGNATDPQLDARAGEVASAVAAVQQRARAARGRWAGRGGPSDRRVLDAVCVLALEACRLDVEADERRLALRTGVSARTAGRALARLAADGAWLSLASPSAGTRGARWALPPAVENADRRLSTGGPGRSGAQGVPAPASPGLTCRSAWLTHLGTRLRTVAVDVFTPAALGHHAGAVYAALGTAPQALADLIDTTGYPRSRLLGLLDRLATHRLARPAAAGSWRRGRGSLDRAAAALDARGILDARARRIGDERLVWAWWCEELAWMRKPRSAKRARRAPGAGQAALPGLQLPIRDRLGRFPRRPDGRASFRAAWTVVTAGRPADHVVAGLPAAA
jgi:hypothetical protein